MTAPARPRRPRTRPAPLVAATPRLAQRARAERGARRRRRLRFAARALLLLLPVAAVAWVVLASSWLAVDEVDVLGAGRVSEADVRDAVAVVPGTPLARVDTGAVAQRVEQIAPVADVAVRRTWPGTLTVEVTERVAAAGVVGPRSVTLVDSGGVPFGAEPVLPPGVVTLEVADAGPDDPATRAALEVHAALPEELRSRVATVRAASPQAVTLGLADGREVVWGGVGGTETKAAAVLALLDRPGTVLDVSGEGVVVVR